MPGDKLQGSRRPNGTSPHLLNIGEYAKWVDGSWYGRCPSGGLANMANHNVIENDDETISVKPSLLFYKTRIHVEWHGYLTDGVWMEC
jgi:hypothetical protein